MTTIYFKNKKEFVNNIVNNDIYEGELYFEKKIPDYHSFLQFIPTVLVDIIVQYVISDMNIFGCKYMCGYITKCFSIDLYIQISSKSTLYNEYTFDFYADDHNLFMSDYNDFYAECNAFMKKQYGKELYLPYCKHSLLAKNGLPYVRGSIFDQPSPRELRYICIMFCHVLRCIQKHEKQIIHMINLH